METIKFQDKIETISNLLDTYLKTKNRDTKYRIEYAIEMMQREMLLEDSDYTESQKYILFKKLLEITVRYNLAVDSTIDYLKRKEDIFEKSYWAILKELNLIEAYKVKEITYMINPKDEGLSKLFENIVGEDYLRPNMQCVEFDGNEATGTDAHKLLHVVGYRSGKFDDGIYPITKKSIKNIGSDMLSPDTKFPKWINVIPDSPYTADVNIESLYHITKNIEESHVLIGESKQVSLVFPNLLNYGENFAISFNIEIFNDVLKKMLQIGIKNGKFHFSSQNRAVIISAMGISFDGYDKDTVAHKNTFGLIMPVVSGAYNYSFTSIEIGKDYFLLTWDGSPNEYIASEVKESKPTEKKVEAKKEKVETKSSEADYLKSKIEAFQDMLEIEDDENEIQYLKDKIEAFKDMLELENDSDEKKK